MLRWYLAGAEQERFPTPTVRLFRTHTHTSTSISGGNHRWRSRSFDLAPVSGMISTRTCIRLPIAFECHHIALYDNDHCDDGANRRPTTATMATNSKGVIPFPADCDRDRDKYLCSSTSSFGTSKYRQHTLLYISTE